MAAEIKRAHEIEPVLTEGSGGIFDVLIDGRVVYSKSETGRFPEPREITG